MILFAQLVPAAASVKLELLLLDRVTRVCGAMRIPCEAALKHARALLELDGDDLYLCTADLSEGLILSMVEDVVEGSTEAFIELRVWGTQLRPSIEGRLLKILG